MDGRRSLTPCGGGGIGRIRPLLKLASVILWSVALYLSAAPDDVRAANLEYCGPVFSAEVLHSVDRNMALRMQQALDAIYTDYPRYPRPGGASHHALADGRIGPVTRSWLERFCADLPLSLLDAGSNEINALLSFASIVERHPEWRKPLMSVRLSRWIEAQPDPRKTQYATVRVFGGDDEIAALLRDFDAPAASPRAEPLPPPRDRRSNAVAEYFKLGAADIDRLANPNKVLEGLAADSRFKALPPFVIKVLKTLQDVEYPNEAFFEAALRAKFVDAFLVEGRPKRDGKIVKTSKELEELEVPREYIAVYTGAWEQFAGEVAPRPVREDMDKRLARLSEPYLRSIKLAARKTQKWQQDGTIDWDAGGCGCVQGDRLPGAFEQANGQPSPGVAYGVFLLWQAGLRQRVDFTMLSRVAYFAVPFDDEGNLLDPLGQNARDRLDFTSVARQHGTRVDWIVSRDWGASKEKSAERLFENLVRQIDAMLREPSSGWWRRLLSRASLGFSPLPKRGDGVTLYFENYPTDPESVAHFQAFYRNLTSTLRKTIGEKDYAVNLLFPASVLTQGILECRGLVDLLQREDRSGRLNNTRFFVMIAEPTIDTKKDLREKVENCVTGERRAQLLQAIVPVIQYDGRNIEQLRDDVAYFDFNFGGVGLWAHPAIVPEATDKAAAKAPEPAGPDIRPILLGQNPQRSAVQAGIDDQFCTVVCPYRSWIWLALEVLLVALVASLVIRWVYCRMSGVLNTPVHLIILGAAALLFLSLLFCDPDWSETRKGNLPLIGLMLIVFVYLVFHFVRGRGRTPMP